MAYSVQEKDRAFARTGGRCHLCGGPIVRAHYGRCDVDTGWQMEHSRALADDGVDDGRNRFAAHPWCNQHKGTRTSRSVRNDFGLNRAPMSYDRRASKQQKTAVGVGAAGVAIGAAIGGGPGAIIGGLLGAILGGSIDPEG
jgi:hypothetical protein